MRREDEIMNLETEVKNRYGYRSVSIEFMPYTDFKINWTREVTPTYEKIALKISDYLEDAPGDIILEIIDMTIKGIKDEKKRPIFKDKIKEYLFENTINYKDRYISRCLKSRIDESVDTTPLYEIYDNLVKNGEISEDKRYVPSLFWAYPHFERSMSSTLFRTIIIPQNGDTRELLKDEYNDFYAVGLKKFNA